ncbi:hypothetical protein [Stenotrophomonas sp. SY1]|uniref:hypothetical protein n=1 Tax=Stenotrophomonas sp. SY1 TaxID=477235 RepID=UPI001E50FCF3|nr:hypothetical protein [Stenotrophomonas sp. SY1]MCD9088772.1 hypothetical protein [Stenotrophomonas sp. SY1]
MRRSSYWFPAKAHGLGWGLPIAWQGWLVYAIAAALLVAGFFIFPPGIGSLRFLAYNWGVILLLVLVCWLKGEPIRLR